MGLTALAQARTHLVINYEHAGVYVGNRVLVQVDVIDAGVEASPQHDTESLQANKL